MRASEEIKTIKDVVKELLTKDEMYRNSVQKLSAKIWSIQLGGMDKLKSMSAFEFLAIYCSDKNTLYSQESIGRASRKVQETHMELRGTNYTDRVQEQQAVKNVIKEY